MNLFSFYLILAYEIAFVYQSSSEHCNEDNLKKCLNTMKTLVDEHFSSMKRNESELNIYCGRVEEDGRCLEDAAADCKKEHPLISASTASLLNFLNMICQPGTDQRSMYLKILPCFGNHVSQFKKCASLEDHKHIEDGDLENLCKDMKGALCFADVSRKVCGEDGELFAKSLEDGLKDTYKDVCSGAYAIAFNVLLIACSVIFGFCF